MLAKQNPFGGRGMVWGISEDPIVTCHRFGALFPGGTAIKLQIFQELLPTALQVLPNSFGSVTIQELKG